MNVLYVLTALVAAVGGSVYPQKSSQCEPITIDACQDMPYQVTRMPNIVNHETQAEAADLVSWLIMIRVSHQTHCNIMSMSSSKFSPCFCDLPTLFNVH